MYSWTEYREIRKKNFNENRQDSKYSYQVYLKAHMDTQNLICKEPYNTYCLAPCDEPQCKSFPKGAAPCDGKIYQKQEEDNLMNYASASISTPATETQDQRKYLERRLTEVYTDKRVPLEATFGLVDDDYPESLEDLKARIEGGKFTFRDPKDIRPYTSWMDMIKWRDPAKIADQAGYDVAKADLKAKKLAALDTIKIDEPKAGLDAIKALEAWTPTGTAS